MEDSTGRTQEAVEVECNGKISPAVRLTRREKEVLDLLVAGKTNKEIARALVISLDTAKAHVSRALRKTGAGTRTEAAIFWERHRAGGE